MHIYVCQAVLEREQVYGAFLTARLLLVRLSPEQQLSAAEFVCLQRDLQLLGHSCGHINGA